jgi:hypothetical protein
VNQSLAGKVKAEHHEFAPSMLNFMPFPKQNVFE